MTRVLESLVSPSSGSTDSCKGVKTSALEGWQSVGPKKASIGTGEGNVVAKILQTQLSVILA